MDGFPLNDERRRSSTTDERAGAGQRSKEWEKATGLNRDDYFATIPSLPISYDAARPILEALGGPNVPPGWQGGLPLPYHVGPGPAEVHFAVDDGLPGPHDLERDRHDPRHGRARPLGDDRQPPRRLGLRRRRPGQRHGRDAGDVPRPGRGRQGRLEAAADARLRELGRRGIRPGRLDRVGRGARRRARREGRAAAERRLGRLRARARPRRRPLAPRLRARGRRRRSPTSASGRTLRDVWIAKQRARPGPAAAPLDLDDPLWERRHRLRPRRSRRRPRSSRRR